MKDFKKNIVGVLILLIGVVVGLILVDQTQVFKNKAKELDSQSYVVCHKTDDPEIPWEEIMVKSVDLTEYLNAGDIFGNCPEGYLEGEL